MDASRGASKFQVLSPLIKSGLLTLLYILMLKSSGAFWFRYLASHFLLPHQDSNDSIETKCYDEKLPWGVREQKLWSRVCAGRAAHAGFPWEHAQLLLCVSSGCQTGRDGALAIPLSDSEEALLGYVGIDREIGSVTPEVCRSDG